MKKKNKILLGLGVVGIALVSSVIFWPKKGNPDVLRHITLNKCVPNATQNNSPKPCSEVNVEKGYVVLKDLIGPLQYLLMPTTKLDGMESPALLQDSTPNFLWEAWQARHFMTEKWGKAVPDNVVSLAINSQYGRTQNHLHIHISCIDPSIQPILVEQSEKATNQWQDLPVKLKGQQYTVRRVTAQEFAQKSPFLWLAEIPEARKEMGKYGVAVTPIENGDFLLLATKHSWLPYNEAVSEDLQDHSCKILGL